MWDFFCGASSSRLSQTTSLRRLVDIVEAAAYMPSDAASSKLTLSLVSHEANVRNGDRGRALAARPLKRSMSGELERLNIEPPLSGENLTPLPPPTPPEPWVKLHGSRRTRR